MKALSPLLLVFFIWNVSLPNSATAVDACVGCPSPQPPLGSPDCTSLDPNGNCMAMDGASINVANTPAALPPPPPISTVVDTSRADNWRARFQNASLFTGDVVPLQQVNLSGSSSSKIFIQQNEAYTTHSNLLFGCAETSMIGRTDADCANFPNDPECAGVLRSLENAATCDIPPPAGSPAGTPCLSYGKYGYVMEEWLVFGQQFYNGMSTCISTRDGPNSSNVRQGRMVNLTDMAMPVLGSSVGANGKNGESSITGKTQKEELAASAYSVSGKSPTEGKAAVDPRILALTEKFDDGATHLGYEKGEVIIQASKGTPFSRVFSDSPFAEKLSKSTKELAVAALEDPKDVVGRVKEKKIALKEESTRGNDMMADLERASENDAVAINLPASGKAAQGATSETKGGMKFQALLAAANAALKQQKGRGGPSAEAAEARAPMAQMETQYAEEGRAPASIAPTDQSLFERVRHSYRRYAPQMKESKTAHDVRTTDLPAFFREL